jgi:general secretion pathway protein G
MPFEETGRVAAVANVSQEQMSRLKQKRQSGMTLVELVVAIAILAILATAVLPVTRTVVKHEREKELRAALEQMRGAIDRYKDYSDRGMFQLKLDSNGYPPTLDELVKGVEIGDKKVKFLRRIPVDPMTHSTEWGMRSMQDEPTAESWGGQAVFDVYSQSTGTALDGTKYSDW